jgi:hypothetical protein
VRNLSRRFSAQKGYAVIIRNLRPQTQQQTLWKSEENLVDLHATGMVQSS